MAWQVYLPFISPWIDVRDVRGTPLISGEPTSYILSSWSFIRSFLWLGDSSFWAGNTSSSRFCYWNMSTYVGSGDPITAVGTEHLFFIGASQYGIALTAAGSNFLSKYGFDMGNTVQFSNSRAWFYTYTLSNVCVLLPSRPLDKDPVSTETCNATVSTSLSGISYRTSYAHRRSWKISLLLDGPIDKNRPGFFQDARPAALGEFLKKAELGVTVHTTGRNPQENGTSIRTSAPYIGTRMAISGQLTGASWTLSGQDDKAMRYKIDLDIDEDPTTNVKGQ